MAVFRTAEKIIVRELCCAFESEFPRGLKPAFELHLAARLKPFPFKAQ